MKNILFRNIYGEPTIQESEGFKIFRGSKETDGGKDLVATCDTKEEAEELIKELKDLEY